MPSSTSGKAHARSRHPPARGAAGKAIAQLCLNCGLCCNGVLFADVELQPGDDAGRLQAAGLKLRRKGRRQCFHQPCACFDGKLCRIYAARPAHCRAFACGVLGRVESGELALEPALLTIRRARRLAERVRRLFDRLGERSHTLPFTRRFAKIMAAPLDLSAGDEALEHRSELMLAMGELMTLAEREFLTIAPPATPARSGLPV